MNDSIQVLDQRIQIKEWAGQRVITFQDIDTVHQRARGTASRNFRENREKFIESVDYFQIQTDDEIRRRFQLNKHTETVTLITESGYLMIVKSLHDDLAWQVQRELVNCYFKVKEQRQPEEIEVSVASHETLLKAAEIAVKIPDPRIATICTANVLRMIVPGIDTEKPVSMKVNEVAVEIPKLDGQTVIARGENLNGQGKRTKDFDGEKLRWLMKERKISGTDIGAAIGVSPNAVSNWSLNRYCPMADCLIRLCEFLSVPVDYFQKTKGKSRKRAYRE